MSEAVSKFDVLIAGAGPAGIAAACSAAKSGARVGVVDNNASAGGQIWRGGPKHAASREAAEWFERFAAANPDYLPQTEIVERIGADGLLAESFDGPRELQFRKLILCTGARERFLPFRGWTLPNVMGAGGLQALVKSGLDVGGKRIVVAGSGPLLLAVATYLREHGGDVRLIAEQASWGSLTRFGMTLAFHGGKIRQAMQLRGELRGVPFKAGCWPVAAEGREKLESITMEQSRHRWKEPCDYLACGFFLVPNTELAELLGCEIRGGVVHVDDSQMTTVAGIFCAGEPTGIGGLELSLVEGQIAGYVSTGQEQKAARLFPERNRQRRFASALQRAFAIRKELRSLPDMDTTVCRCEDVTYGRLQGRASWREAKLQTRCGMGPCQGRICGAAAGYLFGWKVESVRPPVFPASIEALAASHNEVNGENVVSQGA